MSRHSSHGSGSSPCLVSKYPPFPNPLLADIPLPLSDPLSSSFSPATLASSSSSSSSSSFSSSSCSSFADSSGSPATGSSPRSPRLQPFVPRRHPLPASVSSAEATSRARRNFLRRLRRLDHETQLPSLRPFDRIILGLDFFEDVRDEAIFNQPGDASVPSGSPARGSSPRSPSPSPCNSSASDGSSLPSHVSKAADGSSSPPTDSPAGDRCSAGSGVVPPDGSLSATSWSSKNASQTAAGVSLRASESSAASLKPAEEFLKKAVTRTGAVAYSAPAAVADHSSAEGTGGADGEKASDAHVCATLPKPQEQEVTAKEQNAGETLADASTSIGAGDTRNEKESAGGTGSALSGVSAEGVLSSKQDTSSNRAEGVCAKRVGGSGLTENVSSTEGTHGESSSSSSAPSALAEEIEELPEGVTAAEEEDDSDDEFSTRHLQPVPTNFSSVEHYVDIFFPLFLQEAKQAIQRSKKLEMGVPEMCAQVQMKLDEGGDLSLSLERLHFSAGDGEPAASVYTYNDLVLLSHPSIAGNTASLDEQQGEQQPAGQLQEQDQQQQRSESAVAEQHQRDAAGVGHLGEEGPPASLKSALCASAKEAASDAGGAITAALQQQIHLLGIVQRVVNKSSQGEVVVSCGPGQTSSPSSVSSYSSSSSLVLRVINPAQLWEEKNVYWRSRDLLRQQRKEAREAAAAAAAAGAAVGAGDKRMHAAEAAAAAEDMARAAAEKGEQREELRRQLLLQRRERQRDRLKAIVRYLCRDGKPVWNVRRIMNLTSMHREYQALMSLPDLHLISELLCAKNSSMSLDEKDAAPSGSGGRTPAGDSALSGAGEVDMFSSSTAEGEKKREASAREAASSTGQQQQHQQESGSGSVDAATAISSSSSLPHQRQQSQTSLADGVDAFSTECRRLRRACEAPGGEWKEPAPAAEKATYEKEKNAAAAQAKRPEAGTNEAAVREREVNARHLKKPNAEEGGGAEGQAAASGAADRETRGELRGGKAPQQSTGKEEATAAEAAKREEGKGTAEGGKKEKEEEKYFSIPPPLLHSLEKVCNESQMQALRACLKYEGITLIQGPPGTGKTTTILALLSVLLNAQVRGRSSLSSSFASSSSKSGSRKEAAAALTGATAAGEAGRERLKEKQQGETTAAAKMLADERDGNGGDVLFLDERQQEDCRRLLEAQPWLCMRNYTPWSDLLECSFEDLELPPSLPAAAPAHERVLLDKTKTSLVPNRVLVCAPSNAAIDEIVKRLVQSPLRGGGIFNAKGQRCRPSVVRVGPNVRPDLVRYSLEHLAQQLLSRAGTSLQAASIADIKAKIMENQQVVCATLSACGSRDIARCTFDTVVIDEASQGVEISTLIPLRLGCRRVILVGDPRQLPATIFSRLAIQHRYDQSLFERLEAAGKRVNLLSLQYRMHPAISQFASQIFYQNHLKDAPRINEIVQPPLPWYGVPIFKPLVFFSLNTSHQERNASFINVGEARFVCQLLDLVRQVHVGLGQQHWESRVAIISPYAEQVFFLRAEVKRLLGGTSGVDINTVDGFQGQEKDLIIFSAVRAEETGSAKVACTKTTVGFLADERRINVALTRARTNLWVVGNGRFLMSNRHWRALWRYTKDLGTLISIDEKYLQTDHLLKRWLLKFLNQNPAQRAVFEEHLPSFLRDIGDELRRSAAGHSRNSLPPQ